MTSVPGNKRIAVYLGWRLGVAIFSVVDEVDRVLSLKYSWSPVS
jgi:hypothetical protein